jgi:hypothetical protein
LRDVELHGKVRDMKERHRLVCERSMAAFDAWWVAARLLITKTRDKHDLQFVMRITAISVKKA